MQEMQETRVWSLHGQDPLKEEMTTHFSILAWEIPWTEDPGGLHSMGSHRVRHDWSDLAHTYIHTYIRMEEPRSPVSLVKTKPSPISSFIQTIREHRRPERQHDLRAKKERQWASLLSWLNDYENSLLGALVKGKASQTWCIGANCSWESP